MQKEVSTPGCGMRPRWLGWGGVAAALLWSAMAQADEPAALELSVHVQGLQDELGQVVAQLFREGDDLLGLARSRLAQPIADHKATLVFRGLEPGRYAVFAFHDRNGNNDLDHNLFRLPAEPVGYSNNFRLGLTSGMPTSLKLAFTVGPGSCAIDITVR